MWNYKILNNRVVARIIISEVLESWRESEVGVSGLSESTPNPSAWLHLVKALWMHYYSVPCTTKNNKIQKCRKTWFQSKSRKLVLRLLTTTQCKHCQRQPYSIIMSWHFASARVSLRGCFCLLVDLIPMTISVSFHCYSGRSKSSLKWIIRFIADASHLLELMGKEFYLRVSGKSDCSQDHASWK